MWNSEWQAGGCIRARAFDLADSEFGGNEPLVEQSINNRWQYGGIKYCRVRMKAQICRLFHGTSDNIVFFSDVINKNSISLSSLTLICCVNAKCVLNCFSLRQTNFLTSVNGSNICAVLKMELVETLKKTCISENNCWLVQCAHESMMLRKWIQI